MSSRHLSRCRQRDIILIYWLWRLQYNIGKLCTICHTVMHHDILHYAYRWFCTGSVGCHFIMTEKMMDAGGRNSCGSRSNEGDVDQFACEYRTNGFGYGHVLRPGLAPSVFKKLLFVLFLLKHNSCSGTGCFNISSYKGVFKWVRIPYCILYTVHLYHRSTVHNGTGEQDGIRITGSIMPSAQETKKSSCRRPQATMTTVFCNVPHVIMWKHHTTPSKHRSSYLLRI